MAGCYYNMVLDWQLRAKSTNFLYIGVLLQGGHGEVKNITYQDITFDNIARPIVIDQFYCPDGACKHNNNVRRGSLPNF